tara:strand:- start:167 stop:823 length:657 start_codon:yes stop_codon:yes gene_type:complete
MNISKNILLIANGKFPKSELIDSVSSENCSVVCCDGAAKKACDHNIEPDIIIGDMDSISPELHSKFSDKVIQIDEQSSSDLSKALDWLNQNDVESVSVIGADGLRDDHAIGNILLLLENKYKYKIKMITEFGIFDLITTTSNSEESFSFESFRGQAISIFCLDRKVKLNSQGLRYPLVDFTFSKLYEASLNISDGNSFSIAGSKEDINILVYRANEEA